MLRPPGDCDFFIRANIWPSEDEHAMRASGGAWTDTYGSAYATAMSLIILQLPNNYLPILQK